MTKQAILLCLAALVLAPVAYGQAGELDATFGGDGRVMTDFTRGADESFDIVIQTDQRIVAAGGVNLGGDGRFGLARYLADGTLDTSFGGDGKITTNFTRGYDSAFDMALQADGKLVAVGYATGGGGRIALARYDADGTLDTSFGGDGRVITNPSPGFDVAWGVAVQTDQKIVVAGRVGGDGGRMGFARYDSDGSLDTSFSSDGLAAINFTAGDDRADLVEVQADGMLVAAGTANYFKQSARFALVRLDATGSLDPGFDDDGRVTTNFTDGFDGAFAIAVQPDQRIVAGGQAASVMGLARYNTDGSLDPGFGSSGMVTANFTSGIDYADEVVIDADANVLAVGSANYFEDSRFALARFTPEGDLDTTFGGDGKVTTNFPPARDHAFGAVIQNDGAIVAGGLTGRRDSRFALARYLGQ